MSNKPSLEPNSAHATGSGGSGSDDTGGSELYNGAKLFGHPTGLFTLFFAEMWERFSYYGMRALLVLYMLKGFLEYRDGQANAVYGFYTSLVYMTPFIGGMLADKLLGSRRAIIIGGLLMASGHLLMGVESEWSFFGALALLIVGNGFFKPNISSVVGTLYKPGSEKRDIGFTIFYMGINLGAAMSPLLCGYIGETYGWHYGFGLATVGMLVGLAVFALPSPASRICTLLAALAMGLWLLGSANAGTDNFLGNLYPAGGLPFSRGWVYGLVGTLLATAGVTALAPRWSNQVLLASAAGWAIWMLLYFHSDNFYMAMLNYLVAGSLAVAVTVACIAMSRGLLPIAAGAPPGGVRNFSGELAVYAGIIVAIPILTLFVSGFSLVNGGEQVQLISDAWIDNAVGGSEGTEPGAIAKIAKVFLSEISKPAGLVLTITGILAFGYLIIETFRLQRIAKHRMIVALALIFFQMLFFAFFEQAGSSVNLFTDRNVDRVGESSEVSAEMVGQTIKIQPTQEQLGYLNGTEMFTLTNLDALRKNATEAKIEIDWQVVDQNVGMKTANRDDEIPASVFQAVNAGFILIFGLVFSGIWSYLGSRGRDPSSPVKFGLGLIQLGLGFGAFWVGAVQCSDRGMVALSWLILGYLLQTTGELCLSPVGLSTMTKLSPKHLVSTVMGGWFLATAFSQYLAAVIASFAGISEGGGDGGQVVPPPVETVMLYGDVFQQIMIAALISGVLCLALSPLMKAWMHEDEPA